MTCPITLHILKGSFPKHQGVWFITVLILAILVVFESIFTSQLFLHPRSTLWVETIVYLKLQKLQETWEEVYPFKEEWRKLKKKRIISF